MARLGEQLGYSELWLPEDYFFCGSIAATAAVLSATAHVPVGTGVASALVRHPAILAMEIATLEAMHPGRIRPGIGLGVPAWVQQMKLTPSSQLASMRECVTGVRRLLDGQCLNETGKSFSFDNIRLVYPTKRRRMPIYMGVIGPRMLRLSGEIADGTILSVLSSPKYIRWAQQRIALGKKESGRTGKHRVTTFAVYAIDRDAKKAKKAIRQLMAFYLAAMQTSALVRVYGIEDELGELASGGPQAIQRAMPEQWVDDLAVAGDPDECVAKIQALLDAGSDSVQLFPFPPERAIETLRYTASEVLPRLAGVRKSDRVLRAV